jgi:hypothetical protein
VNPQDLFLNYVINFALLANGVGNGAIQINQGGDFLCRYLISNSTGTFTVRFGDGGSNIFFMNAQVRNVNLFGTAQLPCPMRPPYKFPKNGTIYIEITDTSTAPNAIQLCFQGYQIYGNGAQSGSPAQAQGASGYPF